MLMGYSQSHNVHKLWYSSAERVVLFRNVRSDEEKDCSDSPDHSEGKKCIDNPNNAGIELHGLEIHSKSYYFAHKWNEENVVETPRTNDVESSDKNADRGTLQTVRR